MPELKGQRVACGESVFTPLARSRHWTSYSLSTSQVHNHFWLVIVFFKKTTNDLLNCMHAQPIAAVDERIAPDEAWCKRLVVVRLAAEVEFRHTSFGDDAAVIRLLSTLV
jgi:hypothetical protein